MKVKVNYSPTLNEVNELDLALATTPKGECIIGRSPDADLVLDSPDVSRVHGKFFIQSGNYYFCDLGSRNGSIINGKLAEKNRPFLLKDKDVIRIGDYVMTIEDMMPLSEQLPETVFRTIDPALFSGWRSDENVNINIVDRPAPEVISEVPQQVSSESSEELSQPQSEVEISELEEAINTLENIIETPQPVNEVPAFVSEQGVDAGTPVAEEATFIQPQAEAVSEVPIPEEATFIQPQDLISPVPEAVSEVPAAEEATFIQPQDLISPVPEAVSEVSSNINEEDIDWDAEIPQEFTIVQPRSIVIQPSQAVSEVPADINEQDIDWDAEILQEFTNVQPRDLVSQQPEVVSKVPLDVAEILQEFTNVQPRDLVSQQPEAVSEIGEAINTDAVDEFRVDIAAVEAPEFVNSFTPEFSHEDIVSESSEIEPEVSPSMSNQVADISTDEVAIVETVPETVIELETPGEISEVSEVEALSNQDVNVSPINTEEVIAESRNLETLEAVEFLLSTVDESSESTNIESLEITEKLDVISSPMTEELEDETMPELTSSTAESISQTLEEIFGAEIAQSDEIVEELPVSEPQQMIEQKNIVLIAHESKKSELADFVTQHQEFFSKCMTVAWPSISEVLRQQAGITISQQIPAATSGGYQTINSLVNSGDTLAVIFLRDFLVPQPGQANEEALLRSCNINQVLLATNVPTAEAIVHYIQHLLEHQ
ncbi:MAG: FHA domain-containing protein [Aulosira sp. ZfuVER01]|nr:FHA domain-containing protein [Aulosira sp. ZfuVER01]MDZ8002077.1 FHA domain-containing protein [Aulosira sp. DedVER01a]MDZ8052656.1 FHA domain-containing protein [Aulosira sp. ZfuCHP01]